MSSVVYTGDSYLISDNEYGQYALRITFLDTELDGAGREFLAKALCDEYDRVMRIINTEILDTTACNEWLP
jgi:hypothetical protein